MLAEWRFAASTVDCFRKKASGRDEPKQSSMKDIQSDVEEEVGLKRPVDTGSPRCGMNRTRRPYPLNIGLRVTDFA
jgi:hypothetical protein